MKAELGRILCERYPKIFADRKKSIQESCMAWGFSCGDGWFTLIDALCERLQFWTDHNHAPQVVATQVKEKYGALNFYTTGFNETQDGMIMMAEALSEHICETCGQPGRLLVTKSEWWMTRCPAHAPENSRPLSELEGSE